MEVLSQDSTLSVTVKYASRRTAVETEAQFVAGGQP